MITLVMEPDDHGTVFVTSPDLPGMVTFGDDWGIALHRAVGAIEEWIAAANHDNKAVPAILDSLPEKRRAKIMARTRKLIAEEK